MRISEGELVEIEVRAAVLTDEFTSDLVQAVFYALAEDEDYWAATEPFDKKLTWIAADIERLVRLVRQQKGATA